MNAAAIVNIGGKSEEYESIRNGLEDSLCEYISDNFQEIMEADQKDVQYSISIFVKEEVIKLYEKNKIELQENLLSYMVVAVDWKKDQLILVQWGNGMIFAEKKAGKCILSCPSYRETLMGSYSRIKNRDLTKIYVKRGKLYGIKKFIMIDNEELSYNRQIIIER